MFNFFKKLKILSLIYKINKLSNDAILSVNTLDKHKCTIFTYYEKTKVYNKEKFKYDVAYNIEIYSYDEAIKRLLFHLQLKRKDI